MYTNKLSGLQGSGLSFWIRTLCCLVRGCQCFWETRSFLYL